MLAAFQLFSFTISASIDAAPRHHRQARKPLSPNRRRQLLARPNVAAFAKQLAKFPQIGAKQNQAFIETIRDSRAKLYYLTENAILKELNDSIVNKSVATALCNQYKEILWRKVQDSDVLREAVIASYSDWKTIALSFRRDTPKVRQALETAHRDAATLFATEMLKRSPIRRTMKLLLLGKTGLASEMTSWHLAGIGAEPDQATAAARLARNQFTPGQHAKVLDYRRVEAKLAARITRADNLLQLLDEQLPKRSPILVSTRLGDHRGRVISPKMIQLLKKTTVGPDVGIDGYMTALKQRVQQRFGVELSNDQLLKLRDHHDLVDGFSVSIFKEEHKGIDLARAPIGELTFSGDDGALRLNNGLVVVDLAGQGVRNHFQTQRAIARATGVAEAIRGARRAERTATRQMERAKQTFDAAIAKVFPTKTERLTFKRKLELVRELSKSKTPSDFRLTFLPAGGSQPEVAENLEKDLRVALEAVIPFRTLDKAILAIDLVPPTSRHGRRAPGRINLIVGNLPSELLDVVRSTLRSLLPRRYPKLKIFDANGKGGHTARREHSHLKRTLRQPGWHRAALAA